MTGFGRATHDFGKYKVSVEIKSLNSKSLDLKMRVPPAYRERELELRRIINSDIQRGKVDFVLDVTYPDGNSIYGVDGAAFKSYYKELSGLADGVGLDHGDMLYTITRLPGVVTTRDELVSDEEWEDVQKIVNEAVKIFQAFRLADGKPMADDFRARALHIASLLANIEPFEKARIERLRTRLGQNLTETLKTSMDTNRFEQELIFYLEKLDVTEEKVRLRQNCEFFIQELDNADTTEKGRKLGFISQEIGREINTLGSKANDSDIQRLVVEMKDDLEKIKEQLANIL